MLNFSHTIAELLANNNKKITFKHNSVFSGMNTMGSIDDTGVVSVKIANGLINRLNIVRNMLLPHVKSYKNYVTDKIASVEQVNYLSKYKVTEVTVPEIVAVLKDKNVINSDVGTVELPITELVIEVPKEDILSYVSFKDGMLDNLLSDSKVKFTEEEITKIWLKVFGNISAGNDYLVSLNTKSMFKLDEIIVILAIITNIKNEKQPGVRISEGNYIQIMDILHRYIYNLLLRVEDKINLSTKFDKIIMGVNDDSIVVNSELYNKFVETHESDVMLGLLVSGEASVSKAMEDIIIEKDRYLKVWENANKRENFRQISEAPKMYRAAYELMLESLYEDFTEDEYEYVYCGLKAAKNNVNMLMDKIVNEHNGEKLLDVDYIVREIMGDIIFSGTMVDKYLKSVYSYHNANSTLTKEELTTMAGIDMIVEYLLEQVNIETV